MPAFRIAAVVFPDFELLDLYGPLEVFGRFRNQLGVSVVAQTKEPVASSQGPRTVVDETIEGFGAADLLLIPGGWGTRREVDNLPLVQQLRAAASAATWVCTVCTGSALLARTGLLDGVRATSNKRAFDWAVGQGPRVSWVRKARWVKDGKFYTSSGISAGTDMAFAVVQDLFGRDAALEAARGMEYRWNEDGSDDPFA